MSDTAVKRSPDARKRVVSLGPVKCVVRCFPSNGQGTLSPGIYPDQSAVDEHPKQIRRIEDRIAAIGAKELLVPSVAAMSAAIVSQKDLTEEILLPGGGVIRQNVGFPADGIPARPYQTVGMGLDGCRCVVAIGGDHCLIVHVGADSLIDRGRIMAMVSGESAASTREFETVVFAIAGFFDRKAVAPSNISLQCLFGLESYSHELEHPGYADYNKALLKYLLSTWQDKARKDVVTVNDGVMTLHLFQLLKAQAASVGIIRVFDDLLLPMNGYFGHTRHPNESMRTERNLVTATRLS